MDEITDENKKMFFKLYFSAKLLNLENLYKLDQYDIKVECIRCKKKSWAEVRKYGDLRISSFDFINYVHMFKRCGNCRRVHEITIVDDSQQKYEKDNCGQFQPFANFQCVGCKPKVFKARAEFHSQSDVSPECFHFDLTNGEWTGFDKTAMKPLKVYDVESAFVQYAKNDENVN